MENIPNTIKNFFLLFKNRLKNQYDENEIIQFLYILFEKYFGWGKIEVHLRSNDVLSDKDASRLYHALFELSCNRPIQYITGVSFFAGLELKVNPDVLIPRPETEELVGLIIKENNKRKGTGLTILDIGTGSGCIAVSLKLKLQNAVITAMDVSPSGLEVAMENAKRYGCEIRFHQVDILDQEFLKDFPAYDIIVSNPPYVLEREKEVMRQHVLDFEPAEALFVPVNDPMRFNKAIAGFASHHLARPGILYLEINELFGDEVRELLLRRGFENAKVIQDIHGKDRFVKALL
jgi:release factor glutamine methyltransferase